MTSHPHNRAGLIRAAGTAIVVVAVLSTPGGAQQSPFSQPSVTPTIAGPRDEFDRGVPRTTVEGYLDACAANDYTRASAYLDLRGVRAPDRKSRGPQLAHELCVVWDRTLWVDFDQLSARPQGEADDGLPSRRDLVGTISSTTGSTPVLLEQVPREDGTQIWKISATTVAQIPALYEEFGYGPLGNILPAPLFEVRLLQIQLWQWLGILVLLGGAYLAAWLAGMLSSRLLRSVVTHSHEGLNTKFEHLVVQPLRLVLGVAFFYAGSFWLALALPVRAAFSGITKALSIAAFTWLALRLVDLATYRVERRLLIRGRVAAVAILPVGRRTLKVFLIIVAALVSLENVGINMTSIIAGLGIGGLAIALAAQETVKNLFGGVALIADQPVRVGDFCRFGDKLGTVEDISLWSTRVRTPERTVIAVPNGQFVGLQLENFSKRDRFVLHSRFGLPRDAPPDRVRAILCSITAMLRAQSAVDARSARSHLIGISTDSLQIDVSAYIVAEDYNAFLEIQEDIYLRVLDIVDGCSSPLGNGRESPPAEQFHR